jgi:DNA-binding transcriptional ArsR family regulator
MVTLRLAAVDWSRIRFAVSPLWEAVAALRATGSPERAAGSPWVGRVAPRIDRLALPFLRHLVDPARGYLADFLAPPPEDPDPGFEAELEAMLRTPQFQVAKELERAGVPTSDTAVPVTLAQLAAEVRCLWEDGLRADWPAIRAVLEGDIVFRARQLAREGGAAVLAGLHPSVTAGESAVRIESDRSVRRDPGERGLLLVPSVFAWPDLYVVDAPPWRPTVAYPARGIAADVRGVAAAGALGELAGRTRSRVLLACRGGTTTGEMAGSLGLSPAAVSQHVGRLRAAGMIRSLRVGRRMIHELTARGVMVLGAFTDQVGRAAGPTPR